MPLQRSPAAPRRERAAARTAVAILASALLNAGALALLGRAGAFAPAAREASRVVLAAVPKQLWDANREITGSSAARQVLRDALPAQRRDRPSADPPLLRIVEVAPSPDSRRPERARFLADRNNTVARDVQLEARGPSRPQNVLARPSAGAPGAQGIPEPGEEGGDDRSAPGRVGARGADDRIAAARLALAPGGELAGASPRDASGENGARKARRFDPRLLPRGVRYDEPGGGGPMSERLPDVARGDATMLNTWGFRFADFFRRVHDAIRANWDPNRAWDARDPHDRVLGRGTRRVLLDIALDPGGRLKEVRLVSGSGLDFFDRECLRAVEAASPFPNPPRALVNGEGLVVLRRYGLVFSWPEGSAVERLLRGRAE
jgi:TonB family protein